MRPGCALIQAIMGGSPGVLNNFPAECWLDAPTPGMALYNVTDEQYVEALGFGTPGIAGYAGLNVTW